MFYASYICIHIYILHVPHAGQDGAHSTDTSVDNGCSFTV